uniref:Uncharacterized protein n=1 Tax=Arion vulgaris TaxID=1028688 RepID=A0A0B7AEU5_9EUPU
MSHNRPLSTHIAQSSPFNTHFHDTINTQRAQKFIPTQGQNKPILAQTLHT